MSLADDLYKTNYNEYGILTPNIEDTRHIVAVLETYKKQEISVPPHTVIIFPNNYGVNESPVSYIEQRLIFIFPTINSEQIAFQYLHEICHLLIGDLPQKLNWIGELLACSCSYFFYPYKLSNYFDSILNNSILSFQKNLENYQIIKDILPQNQYLVYTGNAQIKTLLLSFKLEHPEFDFTWLLKEAIELCRHGRQSHLLTLLENVWECK